MALSVQPWALAHTGVRSGRVCRKSLQTLPQVGKVSTIALLTAGPPSRGIFPEF